MLSGLRRGWVLRPQVRCPFFSLSSWGDVLSGKSSGRVSRWPVLQSVHPGPQTSLGLALLIAGTLTLP